MLNELMPKIFKDKTMLYQLVNTAKIKQMSQEAIETIIAKGQCVE
jgi:hypothetical protein